MSRLARHVHGASADLGDSRRDVQDWILGWAGAAAQTGPEAFRVRGRMSQFASGIAMPFRPGDDI